MTEWMIQDVADRYPHHTDPVIVGDEAILTDLLWRFARLSPRVLIIGMSDTDTFHVGIGGAWAFIEHVIDEPTWSTQTAISRADANTNPKPESVWFPMGGDVSEIPAMYLMPVAEAIEVILERYRSGTLPRNVNWERH